MKLKHLLLIVSATSLVALTSCRSDKDSDYSSNYSSDYTPVVVESSTAQTSSRQSSSSHPSESNGNVSIVEPVILDADALSLAALNSNPTKTVTNIDYYYNETNLTYTSTLLIDYGTTINAKYVYSYDTIATISLSGDNSNYINTISGTKYFKDTKLGEVVDGAIEWQNLPNSSIKLAQFNIKNTYFEGVYASENIFSADVVDSYIVNFIGKDYNISNLKVSFMVNSGKLSSVTLNYKTAIGANVTTTLAYTYNEEVIVFE